VEEKSEWDSRLMQIHLENGHWSWSGGGGRPKRQQLIVVQPLFQDTITNSKIKACYRYSDSTETKTEMTWSYRYSAK